MRMWYILQQLHLLCQHTQQQWLLQGLVGARSGLMMQHLHLWMTGVCWAMCSSGTRRC